LKNLKSVSGFFGTNPFGKSKDFRYSS
jgi:hypothetical protein